MRKIAQQPDQIALETEKGLSAERLLIVHLVQLRDHSEWILTGRILLADGMAVLKCF